MIGSSSGGNDDWGGAGERRLNPIVRVLERPHERGVLSTPPIKIKILL